MLDFVGFISDNTDLTVEEKAAMLEDFCEAFGHTSEEGRVAFANDRITSYIIKAVRRARRNRVTVKDLVLTPGGTVQP